MAAAPLATTWGVETLPRGHWRCYPPLAAALQEACGGGGRPTSGAFSAAELHTNAAMRTGEEGNAVIARADRIGATASRRRRAWRRVLESLDDVAPRYAANPLGVTLTATPSPALSRANTPTPEGGGGAHVEGKEEGRPSSSPQRTSSRSGRLSPQHSSRPPLPPGAHGSAAHASLALSGGGGATYAEGGFEMALNPQSLHVPRATTPTKNKKASPQSSSPMSIASPSASGSSPPPREAVSPQCGGGAALTGGSNSPPKQQRADVAHLSNDGAPLRPQSHSVVPVVRQSGIVASFRMPKGTLSKSPAPQWSAAVSPSAAGRHRRLPPIGSPAAPPRPLQQVQTAPAFPPPLAPRGAGAAYDSFSDFLSAPMMNKGGVAVRGAAPRPATRLGGGYFASGVIFATAATAEGDGRDLSASEGKATVEVEVWVGAQVATVAVPQRLFFAAPPPDGRDERSAQYAASHAAEVLAVAASSAESNEPPVVPSATTHEAGGTSPSFSSAAVRSPSALLYVCAGGSGVAEEFRYNPPAFGSALTFTFDVFVAGCREARLAFLQRAQLSAVPRAVAAAVALAVSEDSAASANAPALAEGEEGGASATTAQQQQQSPLKVTNGAHVIVNIAAESVAPRPMAGGNAKTLAAAKAMALPPVPFAKAYAPAPLVGRHAAALPTPIRQSPQRLRHLAAAAAADGDGVVSSEPAAQADDRTVAQQREGGVASVLGDGARARLSGALTSKVAPNTAFVLSQQRRRRERRTPTPQLVERVGTDRIVVSPERRTDKPT